MTRRELLRGLIAGAVTGIAGGFFGVGGGAVMVPILTGALALTQHQAHGTSLATIGFMALISIVVYAAHGNVPWVAAIFDGLKPAVTAIVATAVIKGADPRAIG